MSFLKKLPLPITGVMLGFAALGNLLQSYSERVHLLCGAISLLLGILFVIKVLTDISGFKEDMKNPIMASVSGTFSMALMLLAGYARAFIGQSAIIIWYFAILLHIVLIVYFTVKFILKLQMTKVFASYFIVYVGIVVASISAPAFNKQAIGAAFFWFGFVSLLILLVLVTYRYVKFKEVPEPAQPLFCIYTAPISLCVAGYVQSVMPKNLAFLLVMAAAAAVLYVIALVKAVSCLKLKFYPSYAAFTFPFVISAIAMKMTMACTMNLGSPLSWLAPIVLIETIIATAFVIYTFVRFIMFACSK